MHNTLPEPTWTVHDAVTRCPVAASVFTRFRMACVGCAMAPFETLEEAAASYRLNPDALIDEFQRACETQAEGFVNRKED